MKIKINRVYELECDFCDSKNVKYYYDIPYEWPAEYACEQCALK